MAQGHLNTQRGGAGDRTRNLTVTSSPALPLEPHSAPIVGTLQSVDSSGVLLHRKRCFKSSFCVLWCSSRRAHRINRFAVGEGGCAVSLHLGSLLPFRQQKLAPSSYRCRHAAGPEMHILIRSQQQGETSFPEKHLCLQSHPAREHNLN